MTDPTLAFVETFSLQLPFGRYKCLRWNKPDIRHGRRHASRVLGLIKNTIISNPLHGNFGNQEMPNYFQLSSYWCAGTSCFVADCDSVVGALAESTAQVSS